MHLQRLQVENFRAIEKIDVEFDSLVSVIIGPNAIGKTTILEAIRLSKAVLAPRTQSETSQILQSLGAMSPHLPQRIFPAALTTKPTLPLSVKSRFALANSELTQLKTIYPQLAGRVAQQNAGLAFANQNQTIAFLSSQAGIQATHDAMVQLNLEMDRIERQNTIDLNVSINFQTGNINGEFPIQQMMFSALENSIHPGATLFSYFPADRALPLGEQPIQLGASDIGTQLESYNSQPQLKYNRLKHTIFNSIVNNPEGREKLKRQFDSIFDRILRGRSLGQIGINEIGMLSIPIIDRDSGAIFEIDSLSSGEKGLILTFLLISQSLSDNGLVLLDEPELHLNPAVCRDLLQYLVDEYASKKNLQVILCSHSAEILAGTFERPSCSLFHLRGPTSLAKVRHQDQGEIRDALRRLGSSESEALLYRGTISVEGIHDVETLQAGFGDLLRRYRLKQRGGRSNIEQDIRELQRGEEKKEEIGFHYFIFDSDRKPTSLRDTEHVRLLQLDRYCLENYLLDTDILTDLSRSGEYSSNPQNNTTTMRDTVKALAMAQMDENVARAIFRDILIHLGHCERLHGVPHRSGVILRVGRILSRPT